MNYLYALQVAREGWASFLAPILYVISEFALYGIPLVAMVLYISVDKKKYRLLAFSIVLSNFLTNAVKLFACVYRPWVKDARLYIHPMAEHSATGYSFPSGHTTAGSTFYGAIAENEIKGKKRTWFIAVMAIMILLTAFSRNFLGAHTIADVLAAMVLSFVVIILTDKLLKYIDANPEKDVILLISGVAVAVAACIAFWVKSYPMDYASDGTLLVDPIAVQKDSWLACGFLAAWLISWYIDRHYINFTTDISKKNKVCRAIIAAVIFVLLYEVLLKKLAGIMDIRIGSLIRGFFTIFIVASVYPMIFTKVEKKNE